MKIFRQFEEVDLQCPTALTVGTFDGVHLGHQQVIRELIDTAGKCHCSPVLITFYPHPQTVVGPKHGKPIHLLTTLEEKLELLQSFDIAAVMVIPFTPEFARTGYRDFVKNILVKRFGVRVMVIGHDHAFGRNREGHEAQLKKDAKDFGFSLQVVPPYRLGRHTVSSTLIRESLAGGDVEQAQRLLGRAYSIRGKVVSGSNRGQKLSFPTANVEIDNPHKLVPKRGVYAVDVTIQNQHYHGMMNIGHRPTFKFDPLTLEVHIFKFFGSIYDEQIEVRFKKFIREEKQFQNPEELKKQLMLDEQICRAL